VSSDGIEALVRDFVGRINAHDVAGVTGMCAPEHVFIDSLGNRMSGAVQLDQCWRWYFSMFPDYSIEIQALAARGDTVLACGFAAATHAPTGKAWSIPAAWRATIKDGRVAEWQVYADNKPVYDLLAPQA
jgi:ketosteroid isomerase-like protein